MIPAGVQVFLALEPVDMRYGFERLAGIVRERVGYDPRCGALFVFVGKRRTSAKILFCDGSGMCLFYKKLDRGVFGVPANAAADVTHVEIDDVMFEALLDGIEVVKTPKSKRPPRAPRRVH